MSERFCRVTLTEAKACNPGAAATALRNFIGQVGLKESHRICPLGFCRLSVAFMQDPDIDSTTLGNLEAAAAALDELRRWTRIAGSYEPGLFWTLKPAALHCNLLSTWHVGWVCTSHIRCATSVYSASVMPPKMTACFCHTTVLSENRLCQARKSLAC